MCLRPRQPILGAVPGQWGAQQETRRKNVRAFAGKIRQETDRTDRTGQRTAREESELTLLCELCRAYRVCIISLGRLDVLSCTESTGVTRVSFSQLVQIDTEVDHIDETVVSCWLIRVSGTGAMLGHGAVVGLRISTGLDVVMATRLTRRCILTQPDGTVLGVGPTRQ